MKTLATLNDGVLVLMELGEYEAVSLQFAPTYTLPIPHLSQRGDDADARRNDCGAACVAMAVNGLMDRALTVDDVAIGFQQKPNHYMSMRDLIAALRHYGLRGEYKRPLMPDDIRATILAGRPVIALVKYSKMPTTFASFSGSHFIIIYGVDREIFFYRDPLAIDNELLTISAEQLEKAMSGFVAGENLPYQGLVVHNKGK